MKDDFLPWKMVVIIGIIFVGVFLFAFFSCKVVKNANNEPKATEIMSEKTTETEKQTTKTSEQKNEQGTAENTKSINFNFFFFAIIVASCLCAFIIYHTQKCIVRNNELEIERLKVEANSAKNNSAPNEFQNSETKAQIDAQIQLNVKKTGDKQND